MVYAGIPVEWVRLDPAREWLADVACAQTELMLANQLQHSKDVYAQVPAIVMALVQRMTSGIVWQAVCKQRHLSHQVLDPAMTAHSPGMRVEAQHCV